MKYYEQALPIRRQVGDRAGEAATLSNIGVVYNSIGQLQQALKYHEQALPIRRQVGDRAGEATTLYNIGSVYRDTNQPSKAINSYEQSLTITLEMRGGLLRENRKDFLEAESGTEIALTDLLIDQNQPERAFEWINRATTFDLADYTRLIGADDKVADPEARQAIREWNDKKQRLEFLRQQLQEEYSAEKARQMRELEAQVHQQAEAIADRFPILHLGTHGCFNPNGCPNLGMEANTLLFANNEQYDIANAALLGLQNTELITLAACQTAKEANADGQEISGLAYIFERAGAKSVIASLWNATEKIEFEDQPDKLISSEIMTRFYDNLKKG